MMKKFRLSWEKLIQRVLHHQNRDRYGRILQVERHEDCHRQAEVKDSRDDAHSLPYCRHTEENPCEVDQQERNEDFDRPTPSAIFAPLLTQHFLDDLCDAMEDTPDDECPVGSVPDSAHQERDEDVPVISHLAASAPTKGNIDIVFEPSGERDVPSVPEIRHTDCEIRSAEVFRQFESQCLAHSERHERIAGEVRIDLDRVHHAGQEACHTRVVLIAVEHRVGIESHPVGHHHLHHHTP